ncbi:MAG: hypothetical protein GQ557_01630 [Mycoplasmataceae bacterium]|nr:hypothetical protein [Mycoplasmataceae bacterium]
MTEDKPIDETHQVDNETENDTSAEAKKIDIVIPKKKMTRIEALRDPENRKKAQITRAKNLAEKKRLAAENKEKVTRLENDLNMSSLHKFIARTESFMVDTEKLYKLKLDKKDLKKKLKDEEDTSVIPKPVIETPKPVIETPKPVIEKFTVIEPPKYQNKYSHLYGF